MTPINEGLSCDDLTTCTNHDTCSNGNCVGSFPCGDADANGQVTIVDCLNIIINGVAGSGYCPLDACDLTGDCSVSLVDALGCLHCVAGLATCPNNCPTTVSFHTDSSPAFDDFLFGVDYSAAPGAFCVANEEAVCEPLVTLTDPSEDLLAVFPDLGPGQLFPTLDLLVNNVNPEGFSGPDLARCFFKVEPLLEQGFPPNPPNPLDAGDFTVLTGALEPVAIETALAGGAQVVPPVTVSVCPVCGNGTCDSPENDLNCPADCP